MHQNHPSNHLIGAMKLYPETPKWVDDFRASRGKDLPKWPDWCFLPMAAWYSMVSASNGVNILPPHLVGDVSRLSAIGSWRYSQGIYQIDPDLITALSQSTVKGSIPSEVLHRLPEWCVYVETPDQQWFGDTMYGFWAHLEWDVTTKRTELRFLLNCQNNLTPIPLHIGPWTVTEAVDRAVSEATKHALAANITLPSSADAVQQMSASINPLVSILLYLCSEEPEIDDLRQPGIHPERAKPKKTKRGWRLFAAEKPRTWLVGSDIGDNLRKAYSEQPTDTQNRTVKPHLRRGHWHGFWTGPRDSDRKFIYRWLSPLVVGSQDDE